VNRFAEIRTRGRKRLRFRESSQEQEGKEEPKGGQGGIVLPY